jgi:hypothetical protein
MITGSRERIILKWILVKEAVKFKGDEPGSGMYPTANLCISGTEPSGSATRHFVDYYGVF